MKTFKSCKGPEVDREEVFMTLSIRNMSESNSRLAC